MQPMEMAAGPGQMMMMGQPGSALADAMGRVGNLTHARVQQKRKLLEAVGCWNQQNQYVVYAGEDQSTPIFWVQENTGCLQRICCPPDCGPWNMSYHLIGNEGLAEGMSGKHFPQFMVIDRPCTATCLCFNRPEATITTIPDGKVLGTVRDPFSCFNFTYRIADPGGNDTLKIESCCIQFGLCCPCPGNKVIFPILAGDNSHIATMTKTWMMGDCCPFCFKDWDNNVIDFGQASNSDYKMLLIGLVTFVQMRLFDAKNQQ